MRENSFVAKESFEQTQIRKENGRKENGTLLNKLTCVFLSPDTAGIIPHDTNGTINALAASHSPAMK